MVVGGPLFLVCFFTGLGQITCCLLEAVLVACIVAVDGRGRMAWASLMSGDLRAFGLVDMV